MIFRSGYLVIGRYHDAPMRLHWTVPIGAYLLTGADYVPGAWIAFVLLVLIHEFGHAALVRAFGLRVVSIDLTGIGGQCEWSGNATERQRATIAWGGVLAQLAALLVAPLLASLFPRPAPPFVAQMIATFGRTNLLLILLNLLPVKPLDGAEAWRIFWRDGFIFSPRKLALRRQAQSIQRELDEVTKKHPPRTIKPGPDRSMLN
jgi:Zn-dependent protease